MQSQRKDQSEDRPLLRGLLNADVPAMVLNDLLDHGESQARAIFLALAHKRLEELAADRTRESLVPLSSTLDFNTVRDLAYFHIDLPGFQVDGFAGVEQKVEKARSIFF